ncbi:hypothetical protein Taro_013123 [Colocasia esculenta]|uniref:Vacuolar fusion protein MON1 homolog n=1 Tax=Colocasia esculenta TaxID=4460 RepID=A0A843UB03_COLES|nr:hypothetical protein [Colocasia esculenta]
MSSSSASSSSSPRLREGSSSGGSPSENSSHSIGVVSSDGTSHSPRPDGESSDHFDDCFIVDPGTYVPKEPSSHTSGARRPADNVADAQCETSDETLAWMKTHPGLEFPEGYSMYRSSQLRAHYVAKGGVCIYVEKLLDAERLKAKRVEEDAARMARATEDLKETLRAKEELLKAARARSSRLAEEECERIITEYRDSEELNEEVDKLFEAGYNHCIKRIRELRPEYDLLRTRTLETLMTKPKQPTRRRLLRPRRCLVLMRQPRPLLPIRPLLPRLRSGREVGSSFARWPSAPQKDSSAWSSRLRLARSASTVIFLVKGPIYLVCISCTEEPYEALRGQLELIYGQMLVILTKSVNRCFEKNPKFDMTPLLGGTEAVVSLVGAQKASLHPDDVLLLSNFVLSSESFRTSESFSPICLPRYNPMAFLYAYVHYLDVDTYLMLLTTSSEAFYHLKDCRVRIETVLVKSNVLSEVQRSLLEGGLHIEDLPVDSSLRSGSSSQVNQGGVISPSPERQAYVGIGGPAGLWHFIYRSIYLDQYVSSEFSPPLNSPSQQKRSFYKIIWKSSLDLHKIHLYFGVIFRMYNLLCCRLYRAYQRLYASMHDRGAGSHKTQFRRDENYVLLCWITQDFELYATFDPLADKALAIKTCNRVCQWIRDLENEVFLLGASPFSW